MNNIFKVNQTIPYDLRKQNVLQSIPNFVKSGTETISYIASKIEPLVSGTNKNCKSFKSFKQKNTKVEP